VTTEVNLLLRTETIRPNCLSDMDRLLLKYALDRENRNLDQVIVKKVGQLDMIFNRFKNDDFNRYAAKERRVEDSDLVGGFVEEGTVIPAGIYISRLSVVCASTILCPGAEVMGAFVYRYIKIENFGMHNGDSFWTEL
jgi:hypothetical protein